MNQRSACTSILIGKNASADGSVIIGRNEDSKTAWPKHLVVHPEVRREVTETFTSVVTGVQVPLPNHQLKYTAMPEWTEEFGLYEEGGINSAGVAMSATESAYANARVLGYDPFVETGIIEEAMVTLVLPYVKSARAGVARLGELIETYGTGEANGVLFADHDEAWYMEIATGHYWVAQRIPDDSYAVVANQLAIAHVNPDSEDFMMHPQLFAFATEHNLWIPGTSFNFREIFGTHTAYDRTYNTPRVWDGQRLLTPSRQASPTDNHLPFTLQPDSPLHIEAAMQVLGSHYQETDYDPLSRTATQPHAFRPISLAKTQESHLLQLRPNLPHEIADIHWLAMGVTAQSQFVPFLAGLTDTPVDYQRGKLPASLDSAYWQYKLTSVLMDPHHGHYAHELETLQRAVHAKLRNLIAKADEAAKLEQVDDYHRLATEVSFEAAAVAKADWQTFAMHLLEENTALSPLNFTTDSNL